MSTYQPIFDATRIALGNPDISGAVREVARDALDVSWQKALLQESIQTVAYEFQRPSVLFRPALTLDGDKWCALYGANLQDGCAGFGDSPSEAMVAFDKAWCARPAPKPNKED